MAKKHATPSKGGAWIFLNIPRDLMKRARIAAARKDTSIKSLVLQTLEARIQEIEKERQAQQGKQALTINCPHSVRKPTATQAIER